LPLISKIRSAQRAALGIEHVYYFYTEDATHHFHVWMVPRLHLVRQFGRSIESVRPALLHARDHMSDRDNLRESGAFCRPATRQSQSRSLSACSTAGGRRTGPVTTAAITAIPGKQARADAPYRSGRSETWVKVRIRCRVRGEARGQAEAHRFLLHRPLGRQAPAVRRQGAGGFTMDEAREIREALDPFIRKTSPLSVPVKKPKATWVEPTVLAEVRYSSLTQDGLLREPVFKGLREDLADKPPAPAAHRSRGGVPRENILQLLPDAVVPTKEELEAYWRKAHKRALRYLARRPLKLVRHTRVATFYHKGRLPSVPESVHQLRIEKREGGEGVRLWVDDLAGLLGLVEIGWSRCIHGRPRWTITSMPTRSCSISIQCPA
jgi:hypothetical protein